MSTFLEIIGCLVGITLYNGPAAPADYQIEPLKKKKSHASCEYVFAQAKDPFLPGTR